MDDAFAALESGEHALAEKLSRRAAEEGHVNPRIWHDRARIATALGDEMSAEQALRQAILLAPGYAEAHADLGRLLAGQGRTRGARRALLRARDASTVTAFEKERIETELAELGADEESDADAAEIAASDRPLRGATPSGPRCAPFDWTVVEEGLRTRGLARLDRYLDEETSRAVLAALPRSGDAAASDGTHALVQHFTLPLPEIVVELRAELFGALTGIATRWIGRFGREADVEFEPQDLPRIESGPFVDVGVARLDEASALGPSRAPRTRPAFPFRALFAIAAPSAMVLRHELVDLRPGRRRHGVGGTLRAGDLLLACAQQRILTVGGVEGLQEVAHCTTVEGDGQAVLLFSSFGRVV